ncbi:MAG: hypothetical protein FWE16_03600 [Firmicutes bacterium]|nr:hypothetical protein [Bacillota bacterium]
MAQTRKFVIGNVNGQLDMLKRLEAQIDYETGGNYEIIINGDITGGPRGYETFLYVRDKVSQGKFTHILGGVDDEKFANLNMVGQQGPKRLEQMINPKDGKSKLPLYIDKTETVFGPSGIEQQVRFGELENINNMMAYYEDLESIPDFGNSKFVGIEKKDEGKTTSELGDEQIVSPAILQSAVFLYEFYIKTGISNKLKNKILGSKDLDVDTKRLSQEIMDVQEYLSNQRFEGDISANAYQHKTKYGNDDTRVIYFLANVLGQMCEYFEERELIKTVEENGKKYVITNTGFVPFDKEGKISMQPTEDERPLMLHHWRSDIDELDGPTPMEKRYSAFYPPYDPDEKKDFHYIDKRVDDHIVLYGNQSIQEMEDDRRVVAVQDGQLASVALNGMMNDRNRNMQKGSTMRAIELGTENIMFLYDNGNLGKKTVTQYANEEHKQKIQERQKAAQQKTNAEPFKPTKSFEYTQSEPKEEMEDEILEDDYELDPSKKRQPVHEKTKKINEPDRNELRKNIHISVLRDDMLIDKLANYLGENKKRLSKEQTEQLEWEIQEFSNLRAGKSDIEHKLLYHNSYTIKEANKELNELSTDFNKNVKPGLQFMKPRTGDEKRKQAVQVIDMVHDEIKDNKKIRKKFEQYFEQDASKKADVFINTVESYKSNPDDNKKYRTQLVGMMNEMGSTVCKQNTMRPSERQSNEMGDDDDNRDDNR